MKSIRWGVILALILGLVSGFSPASHAALTPTPTWLTSPEPLNTCRVADARTTKYHVPQAIAYPRTSALMAPGIPDSGTVKVAIIPIDFSDVPGTNTGDGRPGAIIDPEVAQIKKWVSYFSNGKSNYSFETSTTWIRATQPSKKYVWEHAGESFNPKPIDYESRTAVSIANELLALDTVTARYHFDGVKVIFFVYPKSIVKIGDAITQYGGVHTTNYGDIAVQIAATSSWLYNGNVNHPTWPALHFPIWSWLLHEVLHPTGLGGHAPNDGSPFNIMTDQAAASLVLDAWDQSILDWQAENEIYCVSKDNLAATDLPMSPIDSDSPAGSKAIFIKLSSKQVLVIESRRWAYWSKGWGDFPGLPKDFEGLLVYKVDTSIDNARMQGEGGFAVYQVNTGVSNGTYQGPYSPQFDLNSLIKVGQTMKVDGISIKLTSSNSTFDSVHIEPITAPAAPAAPRAVASNQQATISWSAPAANGSPIDSYTVTQSTSADGTYSSSSASCTRITTLTCTALNLTNGTTYYFKVLAHNSLGYSPASPASLGVTPATMPAAPSAPSVSFGNARVVITWSAPTNNGAAIDSYTVTKANLASGAYTATSCTNVSSTSCTATGLTNGSTYYFKVSAHNSMGWSDASAASSAVSPAGVPATPAAPKATLGNQQETVTWVAPADNGGAIDRYIVWRATSSSGPYTQICGNVSALLCIATGLSNGTAYYFKVQAHNRAGSSETSTASTAVTPATIPSAPDTATVLRGNARATISWSRPANNGAAIDYLIVSQATAVNGTYTNNSACGHVVVDSCTATGLTNGITYFFKVQAHNSIGLSPWSPPSTSTTPATLPGAPGKPTVLAGDAQVTLTWSAAPNNGAIIDSYTVLKSSTPTGSYTATSPSCTNITATTCIATNLNNGGEYYFKVIAHNAIGNSPFSDISAKAIPLSKINGVAVPTTFQNLTTFAAGIPYAAWAKSSAQVNSSGSALGTVDIWHGEHSVLTNKNPTAALDLTARLYSSFTQVANIHMIYYSFADSATAQSRFASLMGSAANGNSAAAKNNCPTVSPCWGASSWLSSDNNGVVLAGIMNPGVGQVVDSNHINGTLEAHEYTHTIQQLTSRMHHSNLPRWLIEGGAEWSQAAAIYSSPTAYNSYLTEKKNNASELYRLPNTYTTAWLTSYLSRSVSDTWINAGGYDQWRIYDVGSLVTEVLVALKGPSTMMHLFSDVSDGSSWGDVFYSEYGITWADAIPFIANAISAELVAKY